MREVDDAHDAEHEVETDTDQAEVQTEQNAGDERVSQHQRLAPGVSFVVCNGIMEPGRPACRWRFRADRSR